MTRQNAYQHVDIDDVRRDDPELFSHRNRAARDELTPGAHVKLLFDAGRDVPSEEMWVCVTERFHGADGATRYRGELRNDPLYIAAKWGEASEFGPEHVVTIEP